MSIPILVALPPDQVRALRVEARMTQRAMAEALTLTYRWYRTIETTRGMPPPHFERFMTIITQAIAANAERPAHADHLLHISRSLPLAS